MTVHTAGNGLLMAWMRLGATGVLAFLLAYVLGAVPGLPSPIRQILDATGTLATALAAHDQTMRDGQRINRLICRGVWKGTPEMQEECGR